MFRCEECGLIFDAPKIVAENRGEFWGFHSHEYMAYCPKCGSDYFDDYVEDED